MRRVVTLLIAAACWETTPPPLPPHVAPATKAPVAVAPVDDAFAALAGPIEAAIAEGKLPGCVVVVGRRDEVLVARAYGSRSIEPERTTMTADTVFDLAS